MKKEIERVEVYFLAEGGIHLIDETVMENWINFGRILERSQNCFKPQNTQDKPFSQTYNIV